MYLCKRCFPLWESPFSVASPPYVCRMKMYVKSTPCARNCSFPFWTCSLVDFRIGKRWPWAMYGSFPIWKSTNERFPNRKWSPWAIHGSFPNWKSIKIVFQIGNEHHERYMANFQFENGSMMVFQIGIDSISWFSTGAMHFPEWKSPFSSRSPPPVHFI